MSEHGVFDVNSGVFCRYCGDIADTVDHLKPRTWTGDIKRAEVETVPACRECNTALGALWIPTIRERREHVRKYLRRKYRRELRVPHWTPEQLAQLDGALRIRVEQSIQRKAWITERLHWPQSAAKYRTAG